MIRAAQQSLFIPTVNAGSQYCGVASQATEKLVPHLNTSVLDVLLLMPGKEVEPQPPTQEVPGFRTDLAQSWPLWLFEE